MSDRPTPETTSARRVNLDPALPRYVVDVETCERLERERDQWARTASALDISRLKMQRQRDELMKALESIDRLTTPNVYMTYCNEDRINGIARAAIASVKGETK